MIPSRENIFRVLARMEQDCGLPEGGPVSLFICDQAGGLRLHPAGKQRRRRDERQAEL